MSRIRRQTRQARQTQGLLVVSEVALSLVLVAGAGPPAR